jgi:adenosine deaminase
MNTQAIPKVALHDHLDGGLRPQTLIELADAVGMALPERDPARLAALVAARAAAGSLPGYLEAFGWTVGVMQTESSLVRVAREAVIDLAADGVVLAELRFGPMLCTAGGLSPDEVIAAVEQGVREGREEAGNRIEVGLLLCGLRHIDEFAQVRALFEQRHGQQNSLVVGVDLAGPEAGFPPSKHPALLDLYEHMPHAPITLHAGEAAGLDSIWEAVTHGAKRLGHGTRLIDSLNGDRILIEMVRERGIVIEACVSSNVHTGAISAAAEHPFRALHDFGLTLVPCTDNRLMSATTHSQELALVGELFGFDRTECAEMMRQGALASFLPEEQRWRALSAW